MSRKADTLSALNDWKRREFAYGDADCCQFISFFIERFSGNNYAAQFDYASEAEAYELINQHGTLVDFLKHVLGTPSEHIEDGDPVVCRLPIVGDFAGVKLGNKVVCLTEKGFTQVSETTIVCGWHQCLQ